MFFHVFRYVRFANAETVHINNLHNRRHFVQRIKMKTFFILVILLGRQISGHTLKVTKCCKDYEKLDKYLKKCIAFKDQFKSPKLLEPPMNDEIAFWVPPYLHSSTIEYWNGLRAPKPYDFTAVVPAENETVARFLNISDQPSSFVTDVFEEDLSNHLFQEQKYCFEATDNPQLPHVIKTVLVVMIINKCCNNGEQLNRYLSRCENRPGEEQTNIFEYEDTVGEIGSTNDNYWIPSKFMGKTFYIAYKIKELIDYDGPFAALKMDDKNRSSDENMIVGTYIPVLSGGEVFQNYYYCFDSVRDGPLAPKVLIYSPQHVSVIEKCCLPEEILSDKGLCEIDNTNTSKNSTLGSILDLEETIFRGIMLAPCMQTQFDTKVLEASDVKILDRDETYERMFSLNWTLYCVDWQISADGPKEVLGKCRLPTNVKLYEIVRPLGIVSATFLLAAVGAVLIRKQTRTSVHGWALANHALCLAIVNIIQVTWFFASNPFKDCSLTGRIISMKQN